MSNRKLTLSDADALLDELTKGRDVNAVARRSSPTLSLEQADALLADLSVSGEYAGERAPAIEALEIDNRHTERPVNPAELLWNDIQETRSSEIELSEAMIHEMEDEPAVQKVPSIPPLQLSSDELASASPKQAPQDPTTKKRLFGRLFKKKG